MPKQKWLPKTEECVKKFFDWSERGKYKDVVYGGISYFDALREGKKWAGIHMHELYEQGILDGSMPYFSILGGFDNQKRWWQFWKSPHKPVPREVVDFMKKEMFKGIDKDVIESCYQEILKHGIIYKWLKRKHLLN